MADEPRPHWDASLISAVLADLRDVYDGGYGEEQAFRIIAAVEDWQKKRWASITQSPMEVAVQFNALEAAIQRVREVCDEPISPEWRGAYNDLAPHAWSAGYIAAIRSVRRALDGETPNKGDQ